MTMQALTELEGRVVEARECFLASLQELPQPLNAITTAHYQARLRRARPNLLLGEYAPWLFADIASIKDQRSLAPFVQSWLNIYSYVLFIDDAIDQKDLLSRDHISIAAGVLLERGLLTLRHRADELESQTLMKAADHFLITTAAAACRELDRRRTLAQNIADGTLLADKIALLKLCVAYVQALAPADQVKLVDWGAIDDFAEAMQILDDITDWEEDWENNIYSYPVTLAFQTLEKSTLFHVKNSSQFTGNHVLSALVMTGTLETVVSRANTLLSNVSARLRLTDRSIGARFLSETISNNEQFIRLIEQIRIGRETELHTPERHFQEPFSPLSPPQIRKVRQSFPLVAQQS